MATKDGPLFYVRQFFKGSNAVDGSAKYWEGYRKIHPKAEVKQPTDK